MPCFNNQGDRYGRDRTYDGLINSELPYHLATYLYLKIDLSFTSETLFLVRLRTNGRYWDRTSGGLLVG